jgi:hypothetical protein
MQDQDRPELLPRMMKIEQRKIDNTYSKPASIKMSRCNLDVAAGISRKPFISEATRVTEMDRKIGDRKIAQP